MYDNTCINDWAVRIVNNGDSITGLTVKPKVFPSSTRLKAIYTYAQWRQDCCYTTQVFGVSVKGTRDARTNSTADCSQMPTGRPPAWRVKHHRQCDDSSAEDTLRSAQLRHGQRKRWLEWQLECGSRTYSTVACPKKAVSTAVPAYSPQKKKTTWKNLWTHLQGQRSPIWPL